MLNISDFSPLVAEFVNVTLSLFPKIYPWSGTFQTQHLIVRTLNLFNGF